MADLKNSTAVWISLFEALALVTNFYGAPSFARRWLIERLQTGMVRWRYWELRERARVSAPGIADGPIDGDPAFWTRRPKVHWDESRAQCDRGFDIFKIEVLRADVLALLHADPGPGSSPLLQQPLPAEEKPELETPAVQNTATKTWIIAEARRMKAAGEIPAGISITDFAKELTQRMRKAAIDRSLRPVGWRYLRNELPKWKLYPIDLI